MFTFFSEEEHEAKYKNLSPEFLDSLAKENMKLQEERKQYQKAMEAYVQNCKRIEKEIGRLRLEKAKLEEKITDHKDLLIKREELFNKIATLNIYYSRNIHDRNTLIKQLDNHFIRTQEILPKNLSENIRNLLNNISDFLIIICSNLDLDFLRCNINILHKNIEIQFRGPYYGKHDANKKIIDPIIKYFKENQTLSQEDENVLRLEHHLSLDSNVYLSLLEKLKIKSESSKPKK